ncbi:MAG: ATP-binding protein [Clostridia bacterium]|nr:ATP-binding protein [Clostridia bacterium]
MDGNEIKVPKRILNTLLSSLAAGVVPRSGAPYIAIGRKEEIASLLGNLDEVDEGGAAVRFLIGRYGSGKSFLIQLIRGYATDRGFLCADADLSPERRLSGGSDAGLSTYRELMKNLSSKASPDGGALPILLSRYYATLQTDLLRDGLTPEDPGFVSGIVSSVSSMLDELEGYVGGFDFARVLAEYFRATAEDDGERRSACLRWLRGEFSGKTEARSALGFRVGSVIDDENWYDYLKLWAILSRKIGYRGLVVFIDECVNLYKIPNRISREANYEKLLSIFNDTLQGRAKSLCVIFGGTPQFLEDTRRGLFSYEALRSRLADGRFSEAGYQNLSAPVIRLRRLSDNELLALIRRLTILFEQKEGISGVISPERMETFLRVTLTRAGADEMVTPREIIRDYLTLLSILRDHPDADFDKLIAPTDLPLSSEGEADAPLIGSEPASVGVKKPTVSVFDLDL